MSPKTKAKAAIRVPQTREEAAAMLAEYGHAQREIEAIETKMNGDLAGIKAKAVLDAGPLVASSEVLFKGLQMFCEANRATLTEAGKTKTVDFGTGKVAWRWTPAKVTTRGKVEEIIARIKAAGEQYQKFLRATFEIDKVAMLRDPNLAKTITGVRIGSAGEDFSVEPFGSEAIPEAAE
jgi:phage host-nuclease inhibitor protein Gam